MSQISLEIVTPERKVYSADVEAIFATALLGGIGILPNHIPIVTGLDIGKLRVKPLEKDEECLFVGGGFLEFKDNKAVILAKSAEACHEIDVERARKAKERAEERLKVRASDLDVARAEAALKRAIARMKIVE